MSDAAVSTDSGSGSSGAGDGGGHRSSAAAPDSSGVSQVMPSKQAMDSGGPPDREADRGDRADPKPKPVKYKVKRGGAEVELDHDTALAMLGDDYEHEITVGEEKRKAKWRDLVRGYSMSDNALTKLREAAQLRKDSEGLLEWGRQPANIPTFLEQHLGVEDHRQWAKEVILAQIKEETELTDLLQNDPSAYHARMRKMAESQAEQRKAMEQRKAAAEQQARELDQKRKEVNEQVTAALKAVGLPVNNTVKAIASRIYKEYADVDHHLPYDHLAEMVREDYHKEIHGYVDAFDEQGLLAFLGEERRKKLRKLELDSLKGGPAKKPESEPKRDAPARSNGNGKPQKGMTPNEFLRSFKG